MEEDEALRGAAHNQGFRLSTDLSPYSLACCFGSFLVSTLVTSEGAVETAPLTARL